MLHWSRLFRLWFLDRCRLCFLCLWRAPDRRFGKRRRCGLSCRWRTRFGRRLLGWYLWLKIRHLEKRLSTFLRRVFRQRRKRRLSYRFRESKKRLCGCGSGRLKMRLLGKMIQRVRLGRSRRFPFADVRIRIVQRRIRRTPAVSLLAPDIICRRAYAWIGGRRSVSPFHARSRCSPGPTLIFHWVVTRSRARRSWSVGQEEPPPDIDEV